MKPENVKCPECEGPMISRTGKFGIFWGCKNYPQCKGTRDSMGRSKQDREDEQIRKKAEDFQDSDRFRFRINDDKVSWRKKS